MCWPLVSCNRVRYVKHQAAWQKRQIRSGYRLQSRRQVGWNPNVSTHRNLVLVPFLPFSFFFLSSFDNNLSFWLIVIFFLGCEVSSNRTPLIRRKLETTKALKMSKNPGTVQYITKAHCAVPGGGGTHQAAQLPLQGPMAPPGPPGLTPPPPPLSVAHHGEGGEAPVWPPAIKFSPPPALEDHHRQLFASKLQARPNICHYQSECMLGPYDETQWTLQRIENE